MQPRPWKRVWIGPMLIALFWGSFALGNEVRIADSRTVAEGKTDEVKKILVIAITTDKDARRNFENRFVSHLRGRGYDGVTSHSLVADLGLIENRREILDKLAELQVDSALSVRLVPLVDEDTERWGATWEEALTQDATLRQLVEAALPESQTKARRYGVEVTLWGGRSSQRIWAGRTETHTMKQLRKGAGDFVQDVMGTLKLARLL